MASSPRGTMAALIADDALSGLPSIQSKGASQLSA
jgi:hypothetical protein